MRPFFRRRPRPVSRILLVESGSRQLLENLLPALRRTYGAAAPIDLVTCYPGQPEGFSAETTTVYRVADYRGRAARRQLYRTLAARRYSILGIICSAEPIMTKWKWVIAARLGRPLAGCHVFVLNENGDYFWLDRAHLAAIRRFILFRAGLSGSGAPRTLARLLLFPFTLLYLLLYASTVHSKRALRGGHR
jgi:hypothetical protein